MSTSYNHSEKWTAIRKMSFRFFLCFFAAHQLFSSDLYLFLFGFNIKIFTWFEKLYQPLYDYLNLHFLHLKKIDGSLKLNDFLFEILAIVFAISSTLVWSLIDRKRAFYNRADFWLRHFLKYSLAIVLFAYGMDKLIPVQMLLPDTATLDAPIGYYHPSGVFWNLMGAQSFYQSFSGLAEIVGAVLLLFSRTKVIGLLLITGTLTNVLMLNIGFDIGVTYYAINLLIASLYLLYPYLQSITQFFISKEKVSIYGYSPFGFNKISQIIYKIPLLLFIISAFFNIKIPVKKYIAVSKTNNSRRTYDVLTQINNSDTVKMILDDTLRWKYMTSYKKEDKEFATITTMRYWDNHDFAYKKDSSNKKIYLSNDKMEIKYAFNYLLNATSGELTLFDSAQHLKIVLKEFPNEDWPLLKRRNKFLPFE